MNPNEQEESARLRAEAIVRVQSGQWTATEAARRLGVSRKTYYQWERRALRGMITALQEKEAGRPLKLPDPEKKYLRRRVEELEEEKRIRGQVECIRSALDEAKTAAEKKRGDTDADRTG